MDRAQKGWGRKLQFSDRQLQMSDKRDTVRNLLGGNLEANTGSRSTVPQEKILYDEKIIFWQDKIQWDKPPATTLLIVVACKTKTFPTTLAFNVGPRPNHVQNICKNVQKHLTRLRFRAFLKSFCFSIYSAVTLSRANGDQLLLRVFQLILCAIQIYLLTYKL